MYLNKYLYELGNLQMPEFLIKYLQTPTLLRLKNIGYFCGMDYASKNIYDFSEYISRYDHSITTSLLVWKLTKNKIKTLAALFHDISIPCFSHVIDYMNGDYLKQESTEKYTKKIMKNDSYLNSCLKQDNINIDDIIDFKRYSVVDIDRPKLCADRIDGIILTSIGWTKNIKENEIEDIVNDICIYKNEDGLDEIGFRTPKIAKRVIEINKLIDIYCHSKEDSYMMDLLSKITKYAIEKQYIKYEDLYIYDEISLFNKLQNIDDEQLKEFINIFLYIRKEEIPYIELPKIKVRKINPLINGKRYYIK